MKLIADHRKQLGEFEVVKFADPEEVASIQGEKNVPTPLALQWTWEYGSEVSKLRDLYEKGKANNWNAETDLAWDARVSKDEWIMNPEGSMLANLCKAMGKDEQTQKAAAWDEVNHLLSQLLHGEQAALQLCGQLTTLCPTTDEKWYAANQVFDEARHVEAISKFLMRKMDAVYPITPTLKILLDELLAVEGYQKKCLGMQTLFEGMAVGIFDTLRKESRSALFSDMLRRIEQDESRHAAFGILTMRRTVAEASEEERADMEDWAFAVLEALNANQQLDMLELFAPKYGYEPEMVVSMMQGMDNWSELNSEIFMHTVVPNLQRLGLITDRTESSWRHVGLLSDIRSEAKYNHPITAE